MLMFVNVKVMFSIKIILKEQTDMTDGKIVQLAMTFKMFLVINR